MTAPPPPDPIALDLEAIRGRIRLHTSWCAIEDRQVLMGQLDRLLAATEAMQAEVERLRAKNSELNRRCQSAERAAQDTLERAQRSDGSIGRDLARWGFKRVEMRLAKLERLLRAGWSASGDSDGVGLWHETLPSPGGRIDAPSLAEAVDAAPDVEREP